VTRWCIKNDFFNINDNKQPSLIVNDLKHGANSTGAIAIWVDTGTEGFFSDLKIVNDKK
jgi:hypothetical protein